MTALDEIRTKVRFFERPEKLRAWFERHHASATELWIGYFKKGAARAGLGYPEAVEEALCFGWIDGQVRSLDARSYANRYTPRRPGSPWSQTNIAQVRELVAQGRMHRAGVVAFEARDPRKRAGYTFEEPLKSLDAASLRVFRQSPVAWRFFSSQAPSYRRVVTFWVMSGRRSETRLRRLTIVIDASQSAERIDLLAPGRGKK
ncbi:MAG: YdeI/OmpD-associated family protein [Thermoplasmata archaeon]